jgi:branched-chain amino acid aminotransferase
MKDRGISVSERDISLDEIRKAARAGELVEVFACGTAAVITPVGVLKSRVEEIKISEQPGELTTSLRSELTGIQYGTVPDRHNWMHKLAE